MSRTALQSKPPTFRQPYLSSFMVCSCFKLSKSSLSKHIRTLEARIDERETRFESTKGPAWIRLRIGQLSRDGSETKAEGRFQIDCTLESGFAPSRASTVPPNSWEEVRQHLELALKQKADTTCCRGRFHIPVPDLPVNGFARLLLELSASAGKATMNLTGASFDVQGCGSIDDLRWKLTPRVDKDDEDELDLTIIAYPRPDSFVAEPEKIAQMLSRGVQTLMIKAE